MGCFFCYCWGEYDKARGGIYLCVILPHTCGFDGGWGLGAWGPFLSLSLRFITLRTCLSLMGFVCLLAMLCSYYDDDGSGGSVRIGQWEESFCDETGDMPESKVG